jgi:SAM-dependent methyltransferase
MRSESDPSPGPERSAAAGAQSHAERVAMWKRLEIEAADASARTSLAWYRENHGVWSEIEVRTVLQRLRLRPEHRVLDVGCGAGRVSLAIAPRVQAVTAVDISPGCIAALEASAAGRGLRNIRGVVSDLNDLEAPPRSFDRAVAVQMLQHIPDARLRLDAVHRIRRALAPGGRFVTVDYRWGGMISDVKEGTHANGRYRTSFTPDEITALLREAGFREIRVGGCVNTPYRAEGLVRRAPRVMMPLDVALSRLPISARVGKYLVASAVA